MIAAGKSDIRKWFIKGVGQKQAYMLIVFDRMDIDDPDSAYYAQNEQEARELARKFDDDPMCKVMEIYDLSADMEAQLKEKRVNCL